MKTETRDRIGLFLRICNAARDRLATRRKLGLIRKQINSNPRSMSEALRDSGALELPGRDRLTGGWA